MAENKKSFILYCDSKDLVLKLPDESAGRLFKHLFAYVNDENPETDDPFVDIAFEHFKQFLKRDLKKYENYIEKQKANGKKGGRPRKIKTQITQAFKNKPKKADSVSVNDSVNVNVIEEEKPPSIDLVKTTEQIKQIEVIYNTFISEIKEGYHSQWAESSYMSLKIKKGSLTPLLKDFKHQLIKMNKLHKNTLEVRQHFDNWLNKLDSIGKLNQYKTVKIGAL